MNWPLLCALTALAAVPTETPADPGSGAHHDVRVGVVAFEDFHAGLADPRKLCQDLSQQDASLHWRLAAGTYGDVLHWIEHGFVDVALMPAGVFVQTFVDEGRSAPRYRCDFLAGAALPPAHSPWAAEDRRRPGYHATYRSVCVVPARSALTTIDQLRLAAMRGEVEFLFVHPLSASGYIAPLHALLTHGIRPRRDQVRFTYSHSESLRLVSQTVAGPTRVAFVWDDATGPENSTIASLRVLPFAELDRIAIPQHVAVAQPVSSAPSR